MKLEKKNAPFTTVKNMMNYIADKDLSVSDKDVPNWQRQLVWTNDEQGLLAYSILRGYPISQIILWRKSNRKIVPIDGRQRITAMRNFFEGKITIPALPKVETEYQNKKFLLLDGDENRGYSALTAKERSRFEDYELNCVMYEQIDELLAMDIFVMLQGGKSLTKTEVRGALGGKLCEFITSLTSNSIRSDSDDESGVEEQSAHPFFVALASNLRNTRKSHRNVADILLHEFLNPGDDKHWSSLEAMYRDYSKKFDKRKQDQFSETLKRFAQDFSRKIDGESVLSPQLRTAYMILTVFRCWSELRSSYELPKKISFPDLLKDFEGQRAKKNPEVNFVKFTAALSNAGYAKNKSDERYEILMGYFEGRIELGKTKSRDSRRAFTQQQKIAIWERANHQCQYIDPITKKRCRAKFADFRKADADHIVLWSKNGKTTIENGRLLCVRHNRSRKE